MSATGPGAGLEEITKNIYLIANKGYKKSKKNAIVRNATDDCIYSHYEAYVHAENNNFNNYNILYSI